MLIPQDGVWEGRSRLESLLGFMPHLSVNDLWYPPTFIIYQLILQTTQEPTPQPSLCSVLTRLQVLWAKRYSPATPAEKCKPRQKLWRRMLVAPPHSFLFLSELLYMALFMLL